MARSSETVGVLLPGPQLGGDSWGEQWRAPGAVSPGSVVVEAVLHTTNEDGTAEVSIDGLPRTIPEGTGLYEYRRKGDMTHDVIRQIRDALQPLLSDPSQQIVSMATVVRAIVTGTDRRTTAETLVRVARKLSPYQNATDDQRRDALILTAILLTAEEAQL